MPFIHRGSLCLGTHLVPSSKFAVRGLGSQASDNIEMLRALGRDPLFIRETRMDSVYGVVNPMDAALAAAPEITVPTLLLYAAQDEVVPAEPTFQFFRSLPAEAAASRRFGYYPEGGLRPPRDLPADPEHPETT